MITITNLTTLLPLIFINWLPEKGQEISQETQSTLKGSDEQKLLPNLVPELILQKPAEEVVD